MPHESEPHIVSPPKSAPRRLTGYLLVAAAIFVGDQLSKLWAVRQLTGSLAPEISSSDTAVALPSWGASWQKFLWETHPPRQAVVTVLDDFWHFRYVENPGAAWGFLAGTSTWWRTPFFLLVSLSAMSLISYYLHRTQPQQRLLRSGLALVLGGAVGNFADRVRLGYVIDFIDWHWYDKATWPTFNVADAAITVGVVLLLLETLLQRPPVAHAA